MARIARVVIPNYPHHVIQRGVRSMSLFRSDADCNGEKENKRIQLLNHTGWPYGEKHWIVKIEKQTGRKLLPNRPGRPSKKKK